MELKITEKAADELRKAMDANGGQEAAGLRLGIMEGGCCGAKYTLSLAETASQAETVAESQGIKVFVPAEKSEGLTGTVIDFVTTPMGSGFHISAPDVGNGNGGGCGCGSGGGHGHGGGGCGCGSGGGHGHGGGGCGC